MNNAIEQRDKTHLNNFWLSQVNPVSEHDVQEAKVAVDDMFTFHPWTEQQLKNGKPIREAFKELVNLIVQNVPSGADRSAAVRKLREALYTVNAAITHDGRY